MHLHNAALNQSAKLRLKDSKRLLTKSVPFTRIYWKNLFQKLQQVLGNSYPLIKKMNSINSTNNPEKFQHLTLVPSTQTFHIQISFGFHKVTEVFSMMGVKTKTNTGNISLWWEWTVFRPKKKLSHAVNENIDKLPYQGLFFYSCLFITSLVNREPSVTQHFSG